MRVDQGVVGAVGAAFSLARVHSTAAAPFSCNVPPVDDGKNEVFGAAAVLNLPPARGDARSEKVSESTVKRPPPRVVSNVTVLPPQVRAAVEVSVVFVGAAGVAGVTGVVEGGADGATEAGGAEGAADGAIGAAGGAGAARADADIRNAKAPAAKTAKRSLIIGDSDHPPQPGRRIAG